MPGVALWPLQDCPRPEPPCDETLLINELIREYLCWHGLRDSLSVFIPGAHRSQANMVPGLARSTNTGLTSTTAALQRPASQQYGHLTGSSW